MKNFCDCKEKIEKEGRQLPLRNTITGIRDQKAKRNWNIGEKREKVEKEKLNIAQEGLWGVRVIRVIPPSFP